MGRYLLLRFIYLFIQYSRAIVLNNYLQSNEIISLISYTTNYKISIATKGLNFVLTDNFKLLIMYKYILLYKA